MKSNDRCAATRDEKVGRGDGTCGAYEDHPVHHDPDYNGVLMGPYHAFVKKAKASDG